MKEPLAILPITIIDPFAVQLIPVNVQLGSVVSVTYLSSPNWVPSKENAEAIVGLLPAPVSRENEANPTGPFPLPVKPKLAVPPTVCFWMASDAFFELVNVHVGALPAPSVTYTTSLRSS